jgi:hypothetical protein
MECGEEIGRPGEYCPLFNKLKVYCFTIKASGPLFD